MNTDRSVKVKDIVEKFQMEVLYPGADFETETLTITDVNRPGLQFVGFFDYFDPRRLQIIGKALDEIPDGENNTEVLEKVNTAIRGEIDYIFGATISDKVFKFCGPLALDSKGVTFVERFLAAVTPYITSRIDEANKASAARIAKHTAKYAKK